MRNASSLKVKGPDLKNDDNNVNRSISPISMKTSPVQDVYKPDQWFNVPKVVLETVDALVRESESHRI